MKTFIISALLFSAGFAVRYVYDKAKRRNHLVINLNDLPKDMRDIYAILVANATDKVLKKMNRDVESNDERNAIVEKNMKLFCSSRCSKRKEKNCMVSGARCSEYDTLYKLMK